MMNMIMLLLVMYLTTFFLVIKSICLIIIMTTVFFLTKCIVCERIYQDNGIMIYDGCSLIQFCNSLQLKSTCTRAHVCNSGFACLVSITILPRGAIIYFTRKMYIRLVGLPGKRCVYIIYIRTYTPYIGCDVPIHYPPVLNCNQ